MRRALRRRLSRLALACLVWGGAVATAPVARAEPSVLVRPMMVRWSERQVPRLSFEARDFVDQRMAKKLKSGLPQRIVTRIYAYPERGDQPISVAALSCRVVYDLWGGGYRVERQSDQDDTSRTVSELSEVLDDCLDVHDLALGASGAFDRHRGQRVYFAAIVEFNPLSPDTVQRIRRWLSKGGGQLAGDAFFGSFVSIFVSRRMGSAEHSLAFRSRTFTVPR